MEKYYKKLENQVEYDEVNHRLREEFQKENNINIDIEEPLANSNILSS